MADDVQNDGPPTFDDPSALGGYTVGEDDEPIPLTKEDEEPAAEPEAEETEPAGVATKDPVKGLIGAKVKQQEKRRKAEAEAAELRTKLEALEAARRHDAERLQQLNPVFQYAVQHMQEEAEMEAAFAADEAAEAQRGPDPDEDAVGAVLHEVGSLRQQMQEREHREAMALEQRRIAEVNQQVYRAVEQDTAAFRQEHPDFDTARDFLYERMIKGWTDQGYDQATAQLWLRQQMNEVTNNALWNRQRPADAVYRLALLNGYQAATSPNGNGQPRRLPPRQAPKPAPSISDGTPSRSDLSDEGPSLASIMAASPEEYRRLRDRYGLEKLMLLQGAAYQDPV